MSHWAAAFTRYLSEVTVDHAIMKTYSLGLGLDTFRMLALDPSFRRLESDVLLAAYKTSTKRLILCDYDGTLVPSNQVCKHHSSGACQVTQGGLYKVCAMLYSVHMRAFVQEFVTSRIPTVCSITTITCSLRAPEYQIRHAAWSVEHVLA